jgi:hypothetical protein
VGVHHARSVRAAGRTLAAAALLAILVAGACRGKPAPRQAEEIVVWKRLGSWSGHGDAQTESFLGLTGSLRFHWKTTNEKPPGGGRFRLVLQSAISGRSLQDAVDRQGQGEGTAYIAEDPRTFYMLVESANLDWSFTVEEAMFGTPVRP